MDEIFKYYTKNYFKDKNVTYKRLLKKRNMMVFSGYEENGDIFYTMYLITNTTGWNDIFDITLTYPQKDREGSGKVIRNIMNSLKRVYQDQSAEPIYLEES